MLKYKSRKIGDTTQEMWDTYKGDGLGIKEVTYTPSRKSHVNYN